MRSVTDDDVGRCVVGSVDAGAECGQGEKKQEEGTALSHVARHGVETSFPSFHPTQQKIEFNKEEFATTTVGFRASFRPVGV